MASMLKVLALHALKYSGGFWLARRLTARGVRILCYHGIAVADEHRFRGRLFMSPDTFRSRMRLLGRLGYPVIGLQEAVDGLRSGELPDAPVVLTFDDGWRGACETALQALAEDGWPVTLYVTSYYADRQTQVANVAIQYLFWKTPCARLELAELGDFDLQAQIGRDDSLQAALRHCAALPDAASRQAFLQRLATALEVDLLDLQRRGAFMLADEASLRALHESGVDLQLHTHRHTVRRQGASVLHREIADNKAFLKPLTEAPLTHFCYPSGDYDVSMWPELESLGVQSATTCESGFNYAGRTPLLGLRRILDEERLSDLEFEAELSGVLELWKWFKNVGPTRQRRVTPA